MQAHVRVLMNKSTTAATKIERVMRAHDRRFTIYDAIYGPPPPR
jgi:hypothetical protein